MERAAERAAAGAVDEGEARPSVWGVEEAGEAGRQRQALYDAPLLPPQVPSPPPPPPRRLVQQACSQLGVRISQLGDEMTTRCFSWAARQRRDEDALRRIWADHELILGPGCLVEVRRERRGGAAGDAAAAVVVTFVSEREYVKACDTFLHGGQLVLGRPVRAELSGQATASHGACEGACVRWRAESLCGYSKAHDRFEPPPKRETWHPAGRLQLGHLRHPRHPRRASDSSTFTCEPELELTIQAAQVARGGAFKPAR